MRGILSSRMSGLLGRHFQIQRTAAPHGRRECCHSRVSGRARLSIDERRAPIDAEFVLRTRQTHDQHGCGFCHAIRCYPSITLNGMEAALSADCTGTVPFGVRPSALFESEDSPFAPQPPRQRGVLLLIALQNPLNAAQDVFVHSVALTDLETDQA